MYGWTNSKHAAEMQWGISSGAAESHRWELARYRHWARSPVLPRWPPHDAGAIGAGSQGTRTEASGGDPGRRCVRRNGHEPAAYRRWDPGIGVATTAPTFRAPTDPGSVGARNPGLADTRQRGRSWAPPRPRYPARGSAPGAWTPAITDPGSRRLSDGIADPRELRSNPRRTRKPAGSGAASVVPGLPRACAGGLSSSGVNGTERVN
jgi:hypothetical protein